MAQNPDEVQEPIDGATQEPETPLTQEQIDAATMVQQLQGDPDEPTLQEVVEQEVVDAETQGRGLFGATGEQAQELLDSGEVSPEAIEFWQENKPEEQQMVAKEEDDHNHPGTCETMELNADSDEGDWFEPDIPMEMKL